MTDLAIRVDADQAVGLLGRISDNFPTARTWALNRTAEDVTHALRQEASARFIFRGPQGQRVLNWYAPRTLPRGLRARNDKPWATIEPEKVGKILRPFETGAPKTYDRLGRPVAIPSSGPGGARPAKTDAIRKALFPVRLGLQPMRDPKGTTFYALGKGSKTRKLTPYKPGTQGKIKQGKLRTFELPSSTRLGESFVFQRQPGGTLRLLWSMKPSVRRPKLLNTYATAERVVAARWEANMLGAFQFIVRSPSGRASLLDLTV